MKLRNLFASSAIATVIAAAVLFSGTPAHALTIGSGGTLVALTSADVGQSFNVDWS